jgi:hypothetical protein
MHYASLESLEQEQDHDEKEKHEEKDKELKSVLKSSSIPSVSSTIPSTLQGIDSLPDFQRTKLPSNPHLPIVTIRPHQE